MRTFSIRMLATAAALTAMASAHAGPDPAERIAQAESAAPPAISSDATIMETDGTVLREGTNGWTCLPDTMPGDGSPICNDATWMAMMQALGSKSDFAPDRIGISYMLQGDVGAGVSNSTPFHPDHARAEDYTEMGPHLMIIVPKEMLQGLSDDPSGGGPFVMWKDTPYAHIMVPVSAGAIE